MSDNNSRKKFFKGLAVAAVALTLGTPLLFWGITRLLSKDKIELPHYYHAQSAQGTDTVFHQVAEFSFINQLNTQISINKDLEGKMVVIGFFSLKNKETADRLTGNMTLLQRAFRRTAMKDNDTLVQFITITTDPVNDSFPALRNQAEHFAVNHDHWWMLTGDAHAIGKYAKDELGLPFEQGHPKEGQLVLLDKERFIRGYFNGLDSGEVRRCANDIGWLVLEKKHKK